MENRNKTTYQLQQILKYNKDGRPDHQKDRYRKLTRMIEQLQGRGYNARWDIHKFGKKEVCRLVDQWHQDDNSSLTIANKLVEVRWLASKIDREKHIPSNRDLGVGLRKNQPGYGENKARELDKEKLARLGEREQLITELRYGFGLRTKEALRFQYHYAMSGPPDRVQLKEQWTKGGRYREIEIRTQDQSDLLKRVRDFQERNEDRSMIPNHRTYTSYRKDYDKMRGINKIPGHGLRHAWAQKLFYKESGIKAPHAGGPKYSSLTDEEKARWDRAARIVGNELGHGDDRHDITRTYIGPRD